VNYIPFLAGIQFCIPLIVLEIALPTELRDTIEQPFEDFRKFRDRWLVDDEGNPFSFIHKLLQYGLTVSRDWNAEDFQRTGTGVSMKEQGSKSRL
jgi:hypothetical protein